MPDSDPITPALTAEDWEELAGKPGLFEWISMTNPDHRRMVMLHKFEQDNLHGVAAVALHGQPFGFTREDVAYLRAMAKRPDQPGVLSITVASGGKTLPHSLADRLESLLPPEK